MTPPADLAADIIRLAERRGATLATAESCTGGMIAAALTGIPGASAVFPGGVVAYDDRVKERLLGVPTALLLDFGAVSAPVAAAMSAGAATAAGATFAVSTTGFAGPGGGTADDPVGTVYLGLRTPAGTTTRRLTLTGDRERIRILATQAALEALALVLRDEGNRPD